MKFRRLAHALLLLAPFVLVIGALAALSPILAPKNNQADLGQIDPRANGILGEPRDSIDVLFLGDSEVYTSIDPLQLWRERGVTSYDVSTSAQPLPYTRTLLKRALEHQNPEVVVLETNMLFRKVGLDDAVAREVLDAFPSLEYHNRWKSIKPVDFTAEPRTTWTHERKGHRPSPHIQASSAKGYMTPTDERAEISFLNKLYLSGLIDICRERGIKVVLLSTPSTKNWSWKRHNAVEDYLASRPEIEDDVSYLDLNLERQAVPIDWSTDTQDAGDHLNSSGAQKVSTFLASWLTDRYDLVDHRGDAAYRSWDGLGEGASKQEDGLD
ncbi:MAG: hypothetical protein SOU51_03035 [Collinsella sp.]|nr:hypothetical protein [Collinsella sp.]